MNVAERRRGDFLDSVKRANICAVHARTTDHSVARIPHNGWCELRPTTVVRSPAQAEYPKCFRVAYGRRGSRVLAPCRPSTRKTSAPRTNPNGGPGFPAPMTIRAERRSDYFYNSARMRTHAQPRADIASALAVTPLCRELQIPYCDTVPPYCVLVGAEMIHSPYPPVPGQPTPLFFVVTTTASFLLPDHLVNTTTFQDRFIGYHHRMIRAKSTDRPFSVSAIRIIEQLTRTVRSK